MNVTLGKKILSVALCIPLVVITIPIDARAAMFPSQTGRARIGLFRTGGANDCL